ncbi:MAG: hypothetical protein ACM3SR_00650 [Ignavibacteriales bacterium]
MLKDLSESKFIFIGNHGWKRELMKGEDSELLVIIGDDSKNEDSTWSEYFKYFEWRNDRLEIYL